MTTAVLELVCGRCGELWMRWEADTDQPFDLHRRRLDSAGWQHFREGFAPNSMGLMPWLGGMWDGDSWDRFAPTCRCPQSNVQVRSDKLLAAAEKVLRHLYDTRTPLFRTTIDKLLTLPM